MHKTHQDAQAAAFCSREGPEVFHSVQHRHDIWKEDPFDVESIHTEARECFGNLVAKATTPPGMTSGRILLLKGESGAGKTHLMRAFRNEVHSLGIGFFGYMQLTSRTDNYSRYILSNLIDSLDHPYHETLDSRSGLHRLSEFLAESPRIMKATFPDKRSLDAVTALREWPFTSKGVVDLVGHLAPEITAERQFERIDVDLIRIFLYFQSGDPLLRNLAVKYLRCEALAPQDSGHLGGIPAKSRPEDAAWMLEQLGRLMWCAGNTIMVVCVDQLEDVFNLKDAKDQFRLSMSAIRALTNDVPSSIVVISCLENYYENLRDFLDKATVDRVENDPAPVLLCGLRDIEEIQLLVEYRLKYLYEAMGAPFDEANPYYPFPTEALAKLAHMRTRDVLDWCREYQRRCIDAGAIQDVSALGPLDISAVPHLETYADETRPEIALEQAWNDFVSQGEFAPPTEEEVLAELLSQSIEASSAESAAGAAFRATIEGRYVSVDGPCGALLIGVCNRKAQGGGLMKQIDALVERAQGRRVVIVRTTAFPKNPRTQIAQRLGQLLTEGTRRTVVENSEWRAMRAIHEFRKQHGETPGYSAWLQAEKPLSRLHALQEILATGPHRRPETKIPAEDSPKSAILLDPATGAIATIEALDTPGKSGTSIIVGQSAGLAGELVQLDPEELKRHAAFVGGSGSGKTTIALHIVEQLLLQGIPAVLVDRKGDLCRYADQNAWAFSEDDASRTAQRQQLRERLDVALYTPGDPRGRPLAIPLVPGSADGLDGFERERIAMYCAASLSGMMAYGNRGRDMTCRGILKTAIALLCELLPTERITVDEIIRFIHEQDLRLVNAVGHLDTKLFKRLVEDLETLRLNKGNLLSAGGARLSIEALLGRGAYQTPGKTKLSIISTKFLTDRLDVEFWVSQLLLAFRRWLSDRPSATLQAVLLFDEADIYLPAQRKPSTKEPMEDLLKRARSAGLGILLSTQNPGDFDYKCRDTIRTWFLGRIKEEPAIRKMKPMLSECRVDVAAKLPSQEPGQFYLVRDGNVEGIHAKRCLLAPEQMPEDRIIELAQTT